MVDAKAPILVADDLPANLLAFKALLESPDYELVSASSGSEAVRAVERRDFAVVLLDFRMPDMTGIEVVKAIRALRKGSHATPVILVSAIDWPRETLTEAYAAGAVDFVPKPLEPVVLQSKVALFVSLYRARVEAAASEDRFHRLVDAVTDYAIFMLDVGGNVATWNPGIETIKGYRPHEIVGQHFSVFYTAEDRAAGRPERILETVRLEGRFAEEGWRVRKDGTRFWANVVITALRSQDGALTGFAKVTRDLTSRRAAEESERVNRVKDEFLATMSHELRTPLHAIQGWAGILRRDASDPAKLTRGLEVIERNAKAQMRLVSDLLDVSRIISGKLELARARTELLPIVVAAADVVRPAAEAKGIRLVVDVDPAIGSTIADADRLQQVIWNLLTNAVRFTPRAGRVMLVADRSAAGIVLRVQDTGAGIAKEHLPHVFERFVQVDSSTTRSHGGLGLGLAIVRHIVESHGGTVQAESAGLGQGTTFTVTLPIPAVMLESEPKRDGGATTLHDAAEPAEPLAPLADLTGWNVLAVDDDADSLELVRTVLAGAGARVLTATSAHEALALLAADGRFDAIVSDVAMPEVDGYSFMRRVRSEPRTAGVPAIALTANAREEDAALARSAGYQRHLTKPVDARELAETVAGMIRG